MHSFRKIVLIGSVLVAILIGGPLAITLSDTTKPELLTPPLDAASSSVDKFFSRYLQPDGRIGDVDKQTASDNGQAYGLLIAAATKDVSRFESIWNWTRNNLIQKDGLLASAWTGGVLYDDRGDFEANFMTLHALGVMNGNAADKYSNEIKALSRSIVGSSQIIDGGYKVLASSGQPSVSELRDFDPQALRFLNNDQRFRSDVELGYRSLIKNLLGDSSKSKLPADKVLIQGSDVKPVSESSGPAIYSESGSMRLTIRLAASCDSEDQKFVSEIWSIVNRSQQSRTARSLNINGSVEDKTMSAISATSAAAGAKVAHEDQQMYQMLDVADRIEDEHSSLDGSAWVALGRIMLTTPWLGVCN